MQAVVPESIILLGGSYYATQNAVNHFFDALIDGTITSLEDGYEYTYDFDLQVYTEDGKICLRKFYNGCHFCGRNEGLTVFRDKLICNDCIAEIKAN